MKDAKTCNVLTNKASSQACSICKVTKKRKKLKNKQKLATFPCKTNVKGGYKHGYYTWVSDEFIPVIYHLISKVMKGIP